jgi:CheY-like chemotaxis protein
VRNSSTCASTLIMSRGKIKSVMCILGKTKEIPLNVFMSAQNDKKCAARMQAKGFVH